MRVVLVAAFKSEASGILGRLERASGSKTGCVKYWQGGVGVHEVTIVICGAGQEKAAESLQLVAEIVSGAELAINFGVCGVLGPEGVAPGNVISMDTVAAVWHADEAPLELYQPEVEAVGASSGGKLITHNRPVFDRRVASRLVSRFGAGYVDMEAWEVASLCKKMNIPVAVIKAVSDRAYEEPAEGYSTQARLAAANCSKAVLEILKRL